MTHILITFFPNLLFLRKVSDSYLKTDYVMTAQEYAQNIRTIVSSITALQAANKIPEAAQSLVDSLAK